MSRPLFASGGSVLAFALAFLPAGCSLVSGWSDLQNGSKPAGDAGTEASPPATVDSGSTPPPGNDAGSPPADSGSPATDSGSPAGQVPEGVACGSTRCSKGQGCCVGFIGSGGGDTCVASISACATPNTFLSCSDSTACTQEVGATSFCCATQTTGLPESLCRSSCATNQAIVCDPTLDKPGCPTGTLCQTSAEFGYNTCQ
ncbi:MAG TPA: hypothetical protein VGI39_19960 [Polyangiaceae bacterium]